MNHPLFRSLRVSGLALCVATASASAQSTGWNQSAGGTYVFSDTNNWVNGDINGVFDPALALTGGQTLTLSENFTLSSGLSFLYNAGGNITIRGNAGNFTMTLGGDIILNTSGNQQITLGSATANQALNIDLGGQVRTLTVASNRTLGFVNVISNGGIDVRGGTVNFSGVNTYSGATRVYSGNLSLNAGTGSVANSDVTVFANNGATALTFNNSSGGGTTRANSVSLNGAGSSGTATAELRVGGNASSNTVDTITGPLSFTQGYGMVQVTPNASRNARLVAGSLNRNAGATAFFRANNLGVNTIASQTAGSANIVFDTAPTLVGSGAAGTTSAAFIKGAYGATTSSASVGEGLVTYDSTYGVRLLRENEYVTNISAGQTFGNVRLTRAGGQSGIQTITLASGTTSIQSLSFGLTGSGTNAGITITGGADTSLVLTTGVIFANQAVGTQGTSNAMTINVPTLDLNGQEGVFLAFTSNLSSVRSGGTLNIDGAIVNDGGNGVTIGGTGVVKFMGATANTYTGTTTVNSGILFLQKSGGVPAISGDLVINGGSVENGHNQLATTSNITINGGSFSLRYGNEGSAKNITFTNLTMNGGSYSTGSPGHSGLSTILGDVLVNGGNIGVGSTQKITVGGDTTFNGGTMGVGRSNNTINNVYDTFATLKDLRLVNTASGAYTPITVTAGISATNRGGRINLEGDVTFVGNATNDNTMTIASSGDRTYNGVMALEGTRTFDIGDGAATVDFAIEPDVVNGVSQGGLNKTGAGVMELRGNNTYTGATTVSAGTLVINGSHASAVTVQGGVLSGTGTISQAVTIAEDGVLAAGNVGEVGLLQTGDLSLTAVNSTISMQIAGTTSGLYDQISVSGIVDLSGNGQIELNLLAFAPVMDDIFFLILNDGNDAIVGTLYGLSQGDTFFASGYTWRVSYVGDSQSGLFTGGNDLALQVVPEPQAWLLIAMSMTVLIVLRRRRVVA